MAGRLVEIRNYHPADRKQVRAIAFETGDLGESAERVTTLRETVADVLTRYFTDFEPESAWVASCEQQVVGYIIGTIQPGRYRRITIQRIIPAAILRAVIEGALWDRHSWRLLGTAIKAFDPGFHFLPPLIPFPAHFHVDILKNFRNQSIGAQLVARFETHAKSHGISGIHARVRSDNEPARRFFESMGYTVVHTSAEVRLPYRDSSTSSFHLLTYAKTL